MIDHGDPNVVEPNVAEPDVVEPDVVEPRVPDSQIDAPVAYGPDKPKRAFVPESAVPRRRHRRWPWIVLGCLFAPCLCCALSVGVVAGGGAIAAAVYDDHKVTDTGSETIPVEADTPIRLDVDNQVGDVTIQPGATDEITVEWVKTASGFSDSSARDRLAKMSIDASESNGTVSVVVDSGHDNANFVSDIFNRANSVELTITVPDALLALGVDLNIGQIVVDGVGVEELSLNNNTGDVRFTGALSGDGPFEARTNIGDVVLTLPADTRADVQAETNIGSVAVSGFDTMNGSGSDDVTGDEWTGSLGAGQGSASSLNVQVDIGAVTIRAQ